MDTLGRLRKIDQKLPSLKVGAMREELFTPTRDNIAAALAELKETAEQVWECKRAAQSDSEQLLSDHMLELLTELEYRLREGTIQQ